MRLPALLLFFLVASCTPQPGLTPVEQDGLTILEKPIQEESLIYTIESDIRPSDLDQLLHIVQEFQRTKLRVHIVWRVQHPPETKDLTWFPGPRFRQYWDPKQFTPTSNGKLRAAGVLVPLEPLALRIAFARATASIEI
ncbi:hypothetical protein [Bryobacter aggregatus]|uniref:hypothetical protein n=1 Tax=Bryobacter aggregatus TaxID=360054 RepID=UPI0004E24A30|nr:hypothetical protein [Bryobacter aggregatus]